MLVVPDPTNMFWVKIMFKPNIVIYSTGNAYLYINILI